MHTIYQATELLTSNLIYNHIMQSLMQLLAFDQGLLLINALDEHSLVLVDAVGSLPDSLELSRWKPMLNDLPPIASGPEVDQLTDSTCQNLVKFASNNTTYAYLLFSGPLDKKNPVLVKLISEITYLLQVKSAFDSLPLLMEIQSKLKYQLNFFSSMINNIFEPYSMEMLINLYMEIISEMFLFPAAVTLERKGEYFRPVYAKGVTLAEYSDLQLETADIIKNMNFRFFPTVMEELSSPAIGENNHKLLLEVGAKIIVPLSMGEQLDYIVVCLSHHERPFPYHDKIALVALSNILNRALEMQHVKENLMITNRALDDKLYALTSAYKAAEIIFANTKITEMLEIALDMLMEIYQSSHSSVFIHKFEDQRFELTRVKSTQHNENLVYWLKAPMFNPDNNKVILNYAEDENDKSAFLKNFPEFVHIEEYLQPVIIAQLVKGGEYYGFITLSERVTGQSYTQNDKDLLLLLCNSITLALQNSLIYDQLEDKRSKLEQNLNNMYAIQDVLLIIKQAKRMDHFISLLTSALTLGSGVENMSVLAKVNDGLKILSGTFDLSLVDEAALLLLSAPTIIEQKNQCKCLFLPITHTEYNCGYLVIESFRDTVIEDGERIRLLSIIVNIIGDTFDSLLEKASIYINGVTDFSQLTLYRLQEKVEYLLNLGLNASIVRFNHLSPHTAINTCKEWAEGFVILPHTGVLISDLPEQEIDENLRQLELDYQFLESLNMQTLYET